VSFGRATGFRFQAPLHRLRGRLGPLGIPGQQTQDRTMANTKSAKKMVRKIARRTEVNKARRSRMRTHIRTVEEAIASGDKAAAEAALGSAEPVIVRAAQNGVLHRNTASRKVSRLAKRVRALD
jgi:small subunit ribosomal protein S20